MEGKILGYDLTGFRQHLSSEGGKSQLQKKKALPYFRQSEGNWKKKVL